MADTESIEIPAEDGLLPGCLARPARASGPGVLVFHEAAGFSEATREVCERLARAGFAALAPDLYRGRRADTREAAECLATTLAPEALGRDLDAAVACLLGEHSVEGSRVGALGFGTGGHVALVAAARSPRIAAVVDFYGFHAELPVELARVEAVVLGIFAESDEEVPAEHVDALRGGFEAAGVRAHLRVEPGVAHDFMNPARADRFDAVVAEAGWDRMQAFLRAELA